MGAHVITLIALFTKRHFYKVRASFPSRCFLSSRLVDPFLVLHIAVWCHQAPQLIVSPQPGDILQVPVTWETIHYAIGYQQVPSGFIFSLANVKVAAYRLLYLKCGIRPSSHESLLLDHALPLGTRFLPEPSPLPSLQ